VKHFCEVLTKARFTKSRQENFRAICVHDERCMQTLSQCLEQGWPLTLLLFATTECVYLGL